MADELPPRIWANEISRSWLSRCPDQPLTPWIEYELKSVADARVREAAVRGLEDAAKVADSKADSLRKAAQRRNLSAETLRIAELAIINVEDVASCVRALIPEAERTTEEQRTYQAMFTDTNVGDD